MNAKLAAVAALGVAFFGLFLAGYANAAAPKASVTTYHNDNYRTGWNDGETALTPSNVSGANFNLLASALLDDQVDAQPLVMPNQTISGQGVHDVVYVATESNTIYAIDADTGTVLLKNNLGTPVYYQSLPGWCNNNGPNVGIDSTPVIDPTSGTMYVITYTMESGAQTFRIHALDLTTLTDKVPSVVISASAQLSKGQTYTFDPTSSRQRAALLLSNGNVYAGFGSFCDYNANVSRGWVLGWQTGTLAPLASNHLDNTRSKSPDNFFLTSIWMSGFGLAANPAGDVFFVTGNTDPSATTYSTKTNLSESVVSLSSDLSTVESFFSPPPGYNDVQQLDVVDGDFGAGGVMLLPPQTGAMPDLAVAAGKAGILYLLDADNLGIDKKGADTTGIGGCWCGESYFATTGGRPYVIASGGWGGATIAMYQVKTRAAAKPSLSLKWSSSSNVPTGQNAGVFTSVSSHGGNPNSLVIWAVSRPTDSNPADIYLYGFDQNGTNLIPGGTGILAGTWPNTGGDSNIVPTVANGRVYVASYQTLSIFGVGTASATGIPKIAAPQMRVTLAPGEHEIYGLAKSISGNRITVARRDGSLVVVDSTLAQKNYRMAEPSVGNGLIARGSFDKSGVLEANVVQHTFRSAKMWPADR